MSQFLFVAFVALPAMLLVLAFIHGLRIGRAPVFWFAVTFDRRSRPLLYWGYMALLAAAAACATYLSAVLIEASFA